jgi:hypothetical protein
MSSMNLMLRMSISLCHLDTLFIRLLACGTKGVEVFQAADIMDCWFSIEAKFMMASAQFPFFDSSPDKSSPKFVYAAGNEQRIELVVTRSGLYYRL